MTKIFVKYTFCDQSGYLTNETEYKWFDTLVEAVNFKTDMTKKNGGFFHVYAIKEADYDHYVEMLQLERRLAELKAEF